MNFMTLQVKTYNQQKTHDVGGNFGRIPVVSSQNLPVQGGVSFGPCELAERPLGSLIGWQYLWLGHQVDFGKKTTCKVGLGGENQVISRVK